MSQSRRKLLPIFGSAELRDGIAISFGYGIPSKRLRFRSVPGQAVVEVGGDHTHGLPTRALEPTDRAGFFANPFARFRGRTRAGVGAYFDLGLGPYFTDVSRDVDLEVNTCPIAGFGVALRHGDEEWLVGLRFRHASNAGIHRPNYGQNVLQLTLSHRF